MDQDGVAGEYGGRVEHSYMAFSWSTWSSMNRCIMVLVASVDAWSCATNSSRLGPEVRPEDLLVTVVTNVGGSETGVGKWIAEDECGSGR